MAEDIRYLCQDLLLAISYIQDTFNSLLRTNLSQEDYCTNRKYSITIILLKIAHMRGNQEMVLSLQYQMYKHSSF